MAMDGDVRNVTIFKPLRRPAPSKTLNTASSVSCWSPTPSGTTAPSTSSASNRLPTLHFFHRANQAFHLLDPLFERPKLAG